MVQSGESLAEIAKHYYGSDLGNKLATIKELYEANRRVLESPDKICEGDKLTIPPLGELNSAPAARSRSAAHTLLSKFGNLFESADHGSASVQPAARRPASVREYTLRTGDRLWDIADKYLGSGKRYTEIVRLNRLSDPDHIPAGTTLRLPAR